MRYIILVGLLLLFGCRQGDKAPKLTVLEEKLVDSIPSGSGVVMHKEQLIVVADDAPFIYSLSTRDYSYSAVPLTGYTSSPYRIPKTIKPDFEAATKGVMNGKEYVFAFGSGSQSPSRDSLLIVDPDNLSIQKIISLTPLYRSLQQQVKIDPAQWNLEGAVTDDDNLLLLNRGNNIVMEINWDEWLQFIQTGRLPVTSAYKLKLPAYKEHIARLSGASKLNNQGDILFCASIEDTPDWHSDGTVIGSYIGIFNTRKKRVMFVSMVRDKNGTVIAEKIESVDVITSGDGEADIIAVADDDKGHTKLFRMQLSR